METGRSLIDPTDLLLAPWAMFGPIQRAFFVLQIVALLAALWPALRGQLRDSPVWSALVLGTPLLWLLFESAWTTVFIAEGSGPEHGPLAIFHWYVQACVAIAATACLQAILIRLFDRPRHGRFDGLRRGRSTVPWFGVVCALLSLALLAGTLATLTELFASHFDRPGAV